jgi:phosphatidylglycerol:prolipoprotein diacylglycerol transferase
MYPILFKIGPLTVHTYGVMLAAAFFLALALAVRQARKEGIVPEKVVDLGLYLLVAAIVGSRILFILTDLQYYIEHPLKIFFVWEGGLVFFGGLILAIPLGIYYIKKNNLPLWKVADIAAPSIAIAQAVGRLGCFSAGCCYGRPTDIPWAVTFRDPDSLARLNVPLHPTQIYESLGTFLIFLFLIIIRKRKSFDGQLFWLYVLLYSFIRFFIEFYRGDEIRGMLFGGPLSTSQGIGLSLVGLAIYMLLRLKKGKINI